MDHRICGTYGTKSKVLHGYDRIDPWLTSPVIDLVVLAFLGVAIFGPLPVKRRRTFRRQ
jgi:hypothetical protein